MLTLVAPVWRTEPWYPTLLELLIDFTLALTADPALLTDPFGKPYPLMAAGQLLLATWKLSGIDSLAAGWSKGTNDTYQISWKQWDGWYTNQKEDPFSCSVKHFLEFLTGLFKEGLKYNNKYHHISCINNSWQH